MSDPMTVFDRRTVTRHRDRAAALPGEAGFLHAEIAARLAERLDDIRRHFPLALDLGCRTGELSRHLTAAANVGTVIGCDLSEGMARRAGAPAAVADEERLPFADGGLDLIASSLSLHWVNDLPGALIQIRRALKPDGLFLGALLGGETLYELRIALFEAELAEEGGVSPRVSPLADLRDAAGLLQRAGFALPVADRDRITVTYPNALALMGDLRGMGETNATHIRRKTFTRRATLGRASALYAEKFGAADGRIPATFDVLYLAGWAPDAAQPQALTPGSARQRLANALGVDEQRFDKGEKPD